MRLKDDPDWYEKLRKAEEVDIGFALKLCLGAAGLAIAVMSLVRHFCMH